MLLGFGDRSEFHVADFVFKINRNKFLFNFCDLYAAQLSTVKGTAGKLLATKRQGSKKVRIIQCMIIAFYDMIINIYGN